MLWSDPCDKDEEAASIGWVENSTRGCSYLFGAKAAIPFLDNGTGSPITRYSPP